MALASAGDPDIAERVSAASAAQLKMVGIQWVYSPVADVNTDYRNPVIGVRSFGDSEQSYITPLHFMNAADVVEPQKVADYAIAVVRGHASSGVASTAKHFPGHGDTHTDSHLALPIIMKNGDQIQKEELVPFKALIEASVPSIMTGHMALPLITKSQVPCSLSKEITTVLLRETLGFKGVVVTDCLEMDAISQPEQGGCGIEEGALRALQAGADVVMICHTFARQKAALERVYLAVEQGLLGYGSLRLSGERVDKMKDDFVGSWSYCLREVSDWDQKFEGLKQDGQRLSEKVYSNTAKIIWDSAQLLPDAFRADKQLILLTPEMESVNRAVDTDEGKIVGTDGVIRNRAGPSYAAFGKVLKSRVTHLKHVVYGSSGQMDGSLSGDIGGVVFVMRNADVRRWQLKQLEALDLKGRNVPVVLVSSCGPYDLRGLETQYKDWTRYICTYEFTLEGLVAMLPKLFT